MDNEDLSYIKQYIKELINSEIEKLKKELLEYIDTSINSESQIDKLSFEELIQLHNN